MTNKELLEEIKERLRFYNFLSEKQEQDFIDLMIMAEKYVHVEQQTQGNQTNPFGY